MILYITLAIIGVTLTLFGFISLSISIERFLPARDMKKDVIIFIFGIFIMVMEMLLYRIM